MNANSREYVPSIDLNCDLGEGAGHDAELMSLVTSANIACGAHAGDEATMRASVALAQQHGVTIGAHPGLADRENFGRREMPLTPIEAHALVLGQTRRLQAIAQECGSIVRHVKAHGALYNMASRDVALARGVAEAVYEANPRLVLFALAGSKLVEAAKHCRLRVAEEVFADRTYQSDGSLTPRSHPRAFITDEQTALVQAMRMVFADTVVSVDGIEVGVSADTICLHGDGPNAVAFARRLRAELTRQGIELKPISALP